MCSFILFFFVCPHHLSLFSMFFWLNSDTHMGVILKSHSFSFPIVVAIFFMQEVFFFFLIYWYISGSDSISISTVQCQLAMGMLVRNLPWHMTYKITIEDNMQLQQSNYGLVSWLCTHMKRFKRALKYSTKMDTDWHLTIFSWSCSTKFLVLNSQLYQIALIIVQFLLFEGRCTYAHPCYILLSIIESNVYVYAVLKNISAWYEATIK